ncbi:hypothetical protein GCM10011386_32160 [Parapedobacter defluvii]|uniref:Lipocalin-like domain-containing protein n=1 Tax=Parapedobacter defluvii TaxID=2045106 RepID=A0ABQ1ME42_9SPHI|nr:hypothetical protein [Parapedobacter defluvii]GGC37625.1 hypothetical protein GCM10011386_32160 [Parapedobacter defluvii]
MKSIFTFKRVGTSLLFLCSLVFFGSCSKKEAPETDYAAIKKVWLTGSWKQQDITLGVSTSVNLPDGTKLPLIAGSSMISDPTINALLSALLGENRFLATVNNSFTFGADGTYSIDGATDLIMPQAEKAGKWELEVYGAVIALYSSADVRAPYWVNSMNEKEMSVGLIVKFPGLGDVPLNLLLEKQ